jgi:UDP-N-acetylmuramoylalanine-D-glutamate ligase
MFLLKSLTPPEHEVLLIDGNAKPMNEQQLVRFARKQQIGLVGIGAMTRMIARAYSFAHSGRPAFR